MLAPFAMIPRFLLHLDDLSTPAKTALTATLAGGAVLADALAELRGWEEVSLKVFLVGAVIFLTRLLLKERSEHKQECRDMITQHKVEFQLRDAAMQDALLRNTSAVERVALLTEEQTNYFRTVTRNIVDERLKTQPNKLPQ